MPSLRRNRPGTKAKDFFRWPSQSFEDMESTLSYQQFIQQNIRKDPHDIETILNLPESLDFSKDSGIWKYEHVRQFCIELNSLYIQLQDICNPKECPQMSATSQCIYLCASHKAPKECPAIVYTRHTLDGSAALLNANKYFPSRVNFKESSLNKLESICRRIYRIFGHAYYHHRTVYDLFEANTSLCQRFTLFSLRYNMMAPDNIIVPIVECNEQDGVEESILNGVHPAGRCYEDFTVREHQNGLELNDREPPTLESAVHQDTPLPPHSVAETKIVVASIESTVGPEHTSALKQPRSNGGAIASLAYPPTSPGKKGSSPVLTTKIQSGNNNKIGLTNNNTLPKRATVSLSPVPHPAKGVSTIVAKTRHSDTAIPSLAQHS